MWRPSAAEPMRLTGEEVEAIRTSTESSATLASLYGVSRVLIDRIRRGLHATKPRGPLVPSPLASADVAGMVAQGMSDPAIAEALGVSAAAVRRWRVRHGIAPALPWTRG